MAPAMSVTEQQNSRFFRLPAELRNHVYELVSLDMRSTTIDTTAKPKISEHGHPLLRVYQQITHEFAPYFAEAAPNCVELVCHSRNFGHPLPCDMGSFLCSLPRRSWRKYVQRTIVDDDCERRPSKSVEKFLSRSIFETTSSGSFMISVYTVVEFEIKTFDSAPLLRALKDTRRPL